MDEVRRGDSFELRGPIGGYFVWAAAQGGPLFLIAGGSGVVPLMAMLRHRAAAESRMPTVLLGTRPRAEPHQDRALRTDLSSTPLVPAPRGPTS